MKRVALFICMFVLVWSISAFAEEDTVVAKIGDSKITMSYLNRIIGYYDPERQEFLKKNPRNAVTLLKRIVQARVISDLAKRQGFDKRPEVSEQVQIMVDDFIATEYVRSEVMAKTVVTEDDMIAYFKAHPEEFGTPEQVRARHILIRVEKNASEDQWEKARQKAVDILKRIRNGEDFATLASEVSEDPGSKAQGGDLGFFQKGRMVPEFEKAAFALKPGEVSDIVKTPFGFHIIKVEEKKAATREPYEKVKDKVREKVREELSTALGSQFIEKAMSDAKAEIFYAPFMPK